LVRSGSEADDLMESQIVAVTLAAKRLQSILDAPPHAIVRLRPEVGAQVKALRGKDIKNGFGSDANP
jgi:hypothetical protein